MENTSPPSALEQPTPTLFERRTPDSTRQHNAASVQLEQQQQLSVGRLPAQLLAAASVRECGPAPEECEEAVAEADGDALSNAEYALPLASALVPRVVLPPHGVHQWARLVAPPQVLRMPARGTRLGASNGRWHTFSPWLRRQSIDSDLMRATSSPPMRAGRSVSIGAPSGRERPETRAFNEPPTRYEIPNIVVNAQTSDRLHQYPAEDRTVGDSDTVPYDSPPYHMDDMGPELDSELPSLDEQLERPAAFTAGASHRSRLPAAFAPSVYNANANLFDSDAGGQMTLAWSRPVREAHRAVLGQLMDNSLSLPLAHSAFLTASAPGSRAASDSDLSAASSETALSSASDMLPFRVRASTLARGQVRVGQFVSESGALVAGIEVHGFSDSGGEEEEDVPPGERAMVGMRSRARVRGHCPVCDSLRRAGATLAFLFVVRLVAGSVGQAHCAPEGAHEAPPAFSFRRLPRGHAAWVVFGWR